MTRSPEEDADPIASYSQLCEKQTQTPQPLIWTLSTTQFFPGNFLKTSDERHWLSSAMTRWPVDPPLAAGVKGQETAAWGLERAPCLALEWEGRGQGPWPDKWEVGLGFPQQRSRVMSQEGWWVLNAW